MNLKIMKKKKRKEKEQQKRKGENMIYTLNTWGRIQN